MTLVFSGTGEVGGGRGSSDWGINIKENHSEKIGGIEEGSTLLTYDQIPELSDGLEVAIVTFQDNARGEVLQLTDGIVSGDVIRTREGDFLKKDIAYKVMKCNQYGIQVYVR